MRHVWIDSKRVTGAQGAENKESPMSDHQHGFVIGARLRRARLLAKLTQLDVAAELLRSRQAISSWESGKTLPSLLEFKELAALYGVSTDSILFGVDNVNEELARVLASARDQPRNLAAPSP